MNEKRNSENQLEIKCFNRVRWILPIVKRKMFMNYNFQFETENNPIWENTPDHYYEIIEIEFDNDTIAKLYHKEIDELIKFVDEIKNVRKKYEHVIRDSNFYKRKSR